MYGWRMWLRLRSGTPQCVILIADAHQAHCYNSLFRRCFRSPSNFKAYNNVLSCEGLARSPFFKAQSQCKKS